MGTFVVYLLKTSIFSIVFYLFYKSLLSKETHHQLNRVVLLSLVFISLLLPCWNIMMQESEGQQSALLNMKSSSTDVSNETISEQQVNNAVYWVYGLIICYIPGLLFVLGKQVHSLFQIIRIIKKGKIEPINKKHILVAYPKAIASFSWMRYIVISEQDLQENKDVILTHEMAHINHCHSMDLLFMDLFLLLQWFNPAAWLIRQELQTVHEYQADDSVIRQGINLQNYQLLLIKKAVGTRLYSMANSFNHSNLKKRITMMLKEKSSSWARLKYLCILPLTALTISAFAYPEVSGELEKLSSVKTTEFSPKKEIPVQSTLSIKPKEGEGDIQVRSNTSPIDLKDLDAESRPLIILDDQIVPFEQIEQIDPEIIESISVFKDKAATDSWGEKGKKGVIIITTKKKVAEEASEK